MSQTDDIARQMEEVKRAISRLLQLTSSLDGNFDVKRSEIAVLEARREKLKSEVEATQNKANKVLQDASEEAASLRKEALRLLEEAKNEKIQAKAEKEESFKRFQEANARIAEAKQKEDLANGMHRSAEEKMNKLKQIASLA